MDVQTFTHVVNKKTPLSQILDKTYGLKIEKTKADGHCMLYAFRQSWNHQVNSPAAPTIDSILSSIFTECTLKRESYLPFTCLSSSDFVQELQNYLLHKSYLTRFCDVVLLVLANVYGVKIIILNETRGMLQSYEVVPTCGNHNSSIFYRSMLC